MPKLLVEEGGRTHVVKLGGEPVVVGRARENAIVIEDRKSSRHHCRVLRDGAGWVVEDMRSSNGTLLNGRPATRVELAHGDRIQVGEVSILFLAEDGTEDGSAPPSAEAPQAAAAPARAPSEALLEEPEPAVTELAPAASLEVLTGPHAGQRFALRAAPFTIGRKSGHDLVLADSRVSGDHCTIVRDAARWIIEDQGSGNGVIVEKERVTRHALRHGDCILLGSTELRFHGQPSPAAADGASPSAVLRRMDSFEISEEDISRLATRGEGRAESPLQALWTGLFLISFAGILYFSYDVISTQVDRGRVPDDPANLLRENASFESVRPDGVIPGWAADAGGDRCELGLFEGDDVPHGLRALRMASSGPAERGHFRVWSQSTLPIEGEEASGGEFELAGRVRNRGLDVACLELAWLHVTAEGERIVYESLSSPIPPREQFHSIAISAALPSWIAATHCRVGILGRGRGAVEVDNLVLKRSAEPEREAWEEPVLAAGAEDARPVQVRLARDGSFALGRAGEVGVTCVRFATPRDGQFPFGQWLAISSEPPRKREDGAWVGSFGFPVAGKETTLFETQWQVAGDEVGVSWQLFGGGAEEGDQALVMEFMPRAAKQAMTLYLDGALVADGIGLEDLIGRAGDEWTLGQQSQQIILRFSRPMQFEALATGPGPGTPRVLLRTRLAPPSRLLEVFIGGVSSREEQRVADLLALVRTASAERRYDRALAQLDLLAKEFPWREDMQERARVLRAELDLAGERGLAELKEIQADLARFPSPMVAAVLAERARALSESFGDTEVGRKSAAVLAEVDREQTSSRARESADSASELLALANGYFERKRNALARYYAEWIQEAHPGTPQADAARSLLVLLAARK